LTGNCRHILPTLPAESFSCCVTSPPYFRLRDYGHPDQIGQERTPAEYVSRMVDVFREVRRTLRQDGTLWLNLGDTYAGEGQGGQGASGAMADRSIVEARRVGGASPRLCGVRPKSLLGIPWRVALALVDDGWILRSDIIWHKPNAMPESVKDRPTKAHEYLFLFAKSERYYYDASALRETASGVAPGGRNTKSLNGDRHLRTRTGLSKIAPSDTRNRRSVWPIPTAPYDGAHFAVMPRRLAGDCILAGSPIGGSVLDPFGGSGTVGEVADFLSRDSTIIELSAEYMALARARTAQAGLSFAASAPR
jgi:DNA modification methylase